MIRTGRDGLLTPRGAKTRFARTFALTILLPGLLLAAVGGRALVQERRAASDEARQRLAIAATRAAAVVDSELVRWQAAVARVTESTSAPVLPPAFRAAESEPGRIALAVVDPEGMVVWPPTQLRYRPSALVTAIPPTPSPAFLTAETAELRDGDHATALRLYRALLSTATDDTRALILHRVARTARKLGHVRTARTYLEEQARVQGTIGTLPADLVAAYELCALMVSSDTGAAVRSCASGFLRDLAAGRWTVERPRHAFYVDTARTMMREAGGEPDLALMALVDRQLAMADLLAGVRVTPPDTPLPSRSSLEPDIFATSTHLLVTWTDASKTAPRVLAVVADRSWLEANLWRPLIARELGPDVDVEVLAADGTRLVRTGDPAGVAAHLQAVSRAPDEAVAVLSARAWPRNPEALRDGIARRQAIFVALFAGVILVMLCGAYFSIRVVQQELAVAQLKADFVSAVSHEFRSPLTGIRQLGELLMRGRVHDDRRQEYYERITHESGRLSQLVENLLDFSRMEAGRREYRMEPLDAGLLLREVAADFEAGLHGRSSARVEVDIEPVLPRIEADREAFSAALRNLLDNAVKYSPGQPTVWLQAAREGTGVIIRVRDQGVGIRDADRAWVFEPFQRGRGETTRQVKGVGIGLSLVRHIVAAHRGSLSCVSTVGVGTTIAIHLPATTEPSWPTS